MIPPCPASPPVFTRGLLCRYEQPVPSYSSSSRVGETPFLPEGRTLFVFDVITGESIMDDSPNVIVQQNSLAATGWSGVSWPSPSTASPLPTIAVDAATADEASEEALIGQTAGPTQEEAHRQEVARRKQLQRSNNSRLSHEHWMLEHVCALCATSCLYLLLIFAVGLINCAC